MTAQTMYERQAELNLTIPDRVAIVGCGGVGSWLAYFLALAGVPELHLWDFDTVSEHNLNRLPFGSPNTIGQHKSDALAAFLRTLRPEGQFLALSRFTPEATKTLQTETNWCAACTDTLQSRREIHRYCLNQGIYYIECAAEGDTGSVSASPAEFSTPEERAPGYAHVPVWVGPCVISAYLAATHILHGMRPSHNYRLTHDAAITPDGEPINEHTFNTIILQSTED